MRHITVINKTKQTLVGDNICLANSFFTRLFGLLGKRGLDAGAGLLIRPSSGVHTFGMRFPIDVVALDRNLRVVAVDEAVKPWRLSGLRLRTRQVLELPPGQSKIAGIQPGDYLELGEAVKTS